MAGLIGTGTGLRQKAQQGLTAVANLENQRNMQQDALDAQAKAQEMQLYGTAMGIGGAYGVNKALASKGAEAAGGGFVSPSGGMAGMAKGANAGAIESTAVRTAPNNVTGIFSPKSAMAGGVNEGVVLGGQKAAGGKVVAGEVIGGEAVKAAGTEATNAVATEGAKAAAGSSSGALSTLGTIATPIAIGLGAAFLLNKLFG